MRKPKYITIIVIILLIGLGIYFFQSRPEKQKTVNPEKIAEVIKGLESQYPPRIGKNPTQEEIYNNPYIKRIRLSLNEYLSGSTVGIEDFAFDQKNADGLQCGLDFFDKSYFKSKFIVLSASDNDYGGVQASIIFIDKPDKIFWVWIYNDSAIRTFCEDTKHSFLVEPVKENIRNNMYPISL